MSAPSVPRPVSQLLHAAFMVFTEPSMVVGRDDVGELRRVERLPGELLGVGDEALELGLRAAIQCVRRGSLLRDRPFGLLHVAVEFGLSLGHLRWPLALRGACPYPTRFRTQACFR